MSILELMNRIGGRKLAATAMLFITSTAVLFFQLAGIDFQQWANFNLILVGIFVGGNVGEHFAGRKIKE